MRKTAAGSTRWMIVFGTAWLVTVLVQLLLRPEGPGIHFTTILPGMVAALLLGTLILRK